MGFTAGRVGEREEGGGNTGALSPNQTPYMRGAHTQSHTRVCTEPLSLLGRPYRISSFGSLSLSLFHLAPYWVVVIQSDAVQWSWRSFGRGAVEELGVASRPQLESWAELKRLLVRFFISFFQVEQQRGRKKAALLLLM